LKVPGSPSSALQTMTLAAPGALRALAHLTAVAKPAPPRPRRLEACISASQPSRRGRWRRRARPAACRGQQGVPAADVVVDLEVFGGPQLERALLADQFGDLVDAPVAELADGGH
jgi:hypothetical protein